MMESTDRDELRLSVSSGSMEGYSESSESRNSRENSAFTTLREPSNVSNQESDTDIVSLRPGYQRWIAGGPKTFAFWNMLYILLKVSGNVYLGTVIETIEKQFKLSSTESGALAILNDAMDIGLVVFVAYFGQSRHRPRIIGAGAVIVGLGFLSCAVPHFRLPPYTTAPLGCNYTVQSSDYCSTDPNDKADPCELNFDQPPENPVAWLIIGQIMIGIGNVPAKPLGTTYIDDAVGKHTTPVYIAGFFIAASCGSMSGLFLGSLTNSLFVDFDRVAPEDQPSFRQTDPRYIGAWWLGFLVIGCAVLLGSIPYFFFPRQLPKTRERRQEKQQAEEEQQPEEEKEEEFQETRDDDVEMHELSEQTDKKKKKEVRNDVPLFRKAIVVFKNMLLNYGKLVTNVPLILLCLSSAASAAVTAAYGTFALKYFRVELGVAASQASQLAAIPITCIITGSLLGGLIIRRWKLSPSKCVVILIIGDAIGILCMPAFVLLGCSTKTIAGVSTHYVAPPPFNELPLIIQPLEFADSVQQAVSPCNFNCTCGKEDYNPVCGVDGITYVSPCYAGCEVVDREKDENGRGVSSFSACRCIKPGGVNATAVDGECIGNCQDWHLAVIMSVVAVQFLTNNLGVTGLALITLRIVEEDMRATALGFQTLILNLLGYFPAPVYFGAAINLACILWGYNNGDRGACWVYDTDIYRYAFQGLIGGLKVVSFLVFLAVFYALRKEKGKKCKKETAKDENE